MISYYAVQLCFVLFFFLDRVPRCKTHTDRLFSSLSLRQWPEPSLSLCYVCFDKSTLKDLSQARGIIKIAFILNVCHPIKEGLWLCKWSSENVVKPRGNRGDHLLGVWMRNSQHPKMTKTLTIAVVKNQAWNGISDITIKTLQFSQTFGKQNVMCCLIQ